MSNKDNSSSFPIHTLDLKFLGIEGAIACYLIPHEEGAVLVECGPGSTVPVLQAHLRSAGFAAREISDVLLTHIHLDHAGASGWLAQHGARIHVHPIGAPHLIEPERLLSSAERIYGDQMELLWGEFFPVPESSLVIHQDREFIEINNLVFQAIETPGHASHHFAYLFNSACFTGDIGGVRMAETKHVRLPMPPPEFHLESWKQSIEVLRNENISCILPTHFGMFTDPEWHFAALMDGLNDVEIWMEEFMPKKLPPNEFRAEFLRWESERARKDHINNQISDVYRAANPPEISILGIQRYWQKHRQTG